jgi:hypothetical protein
MGKAMSKDLRIALTALWFLLAASSAQAKPLTWTLQDVRFDDGGTASGFFVFDPETIEFDQQKQQWTATPPTIFDLVTTGDIVGGEFHYQSDLYDAFICPGYLCSNFAIVFGSFLLLDLEFDAPLPVLGGTVPVGGSEQLFEEFGFFRQITAGSVTTVPEPGSCALVAVGGALLMLLRRRTVPVSAWKGFRSVPAQR